MKGRSRDGGVEGGEETMFPSSLLLRSGAEDGTGAEGRLGQK
jgi:hypothetical protein